VTLTMICSGSEGFWAEDIPRNARGKIKAIKNSLHDDQSHRDIRFLLSLLKTHGFLDIQTIFQIKLVSLYIDLKLHDLAARFL